MRYPLGFAFLAACSFNPVSARLDDAPVASPDARPDARHDAQPDGPGSGSGSNSAGGCLGRWRDGSIRFNPPTELAPLMVGTYDDDPFITPDGLTMYFDGNGASSLDVFSATRAHATDPFPTPQVVASLSSAQDESKVSITGDGRDVFLASTLTGGLGGFDVWETTRPDATSAFGTWSQANLASVNSSTDDYDPAISYDGQHLYFAPVLGSTQHVVVATRQPDRTFAAPVELAELVDSNGAADADPAISHDELVLVFSSERTGTGIPGARNMWYATRATTTSAFSAPMLLPDVNTDNNDGGADLSDDGCTLYFSSDRNAGEIHIWVATVM